MIKLDDTLTVEDLDLALTRFWEISAQKILMIEEAFDPSLGAPVFTAAGKYTSRGWTDWTQGFQYGSALLQFDAQGDDRFLAIGRQATVEKMTGHLTHFGVHDHGFNNISTYGNLLRLMCDGKIAENEWEKAVYVNALKVSGAVQARRWTALPDDSGYVYSFNGPHSLFADTIRSMRVLAVSHRLGHVYLGEHDARVSLLERLVKHAETTAKYNVYYGDGRDAYDVWGRVAHESIFNLNDGQYRCPNSQQGYSPFSTWTRGLAWIMLGYAEQLEFLATVEDEDLNNVGGREHVHEFMLKAAKASCDFYIESSPTDGIPYWDTGAPYLYELENHQERPSDPFNEYEPVDSSAAAIGSQALLRLGAYLKKSGDGEGGERYWQAGLKVCQSLFAGPYLCESETHQGLILHSVYHRPNGWDYVPPGYEIPCGEASMWGDYHARETALYLQRILNNEFASCFFSVDA